MWQNKFKRRVWRQNGGALKTCKRPKPLWRRWLVGRLALLIIIFQIAVIHPDLFLQTARCSPRGRAEHGCHVSRSSPLFVGASRALFALVGWNCWTVFAPRAALAFSAFSLLRSCRYRFLPEWRRVRNAVLKGVIFFTCSFIYFSEKLDWHGCTYSDFFGRILTVISIFFKQFLGCFGLSLVLLTCCI